jgi:molecular chaperone DnaK
LVYQTEKLLRENRDKIPEPEIKPIEDAVQATKDAINSGNVADIRARMDELNKASHRLAEVMYQAAQQQQAGPGPETGGAPGGGNDGDVVDAEFEESK